MTTPARARRRSIIERIVDWMTESPDPRRFDELRPILGGTPKAKAPRVVVACREVDIDMRPVTR